MKTNRSPHSMLPIAMSATLATWAACAQAADTTRWVMSFPSPTDDAVEFERRYGGVAFTNSDKGNCAACTNRLLSTSDTSGSFARWEFTNPAALRGGNDDQLGLLIPLDPEWSWNHDLRKASKIRMKVRSKGRAYKYDFGLDGPAAPFSSLGLLPENRFSAGTQWRWVSLEFQDFAGNVEVVENLLGSTVAVSVADSMGRIRTATAKLDREEFSAYNNTADTPFYDDDSVNILKHVRAFKIIPVSSERSTTGTLEIDSIVIEGIAPQWGRIRQGSACQGSAIVVDQHRPPLEYHIENMLGGRWERTLDTSRGNPNGISTGLSTVGPQSVEEWPPSFVAQMDAKLHRVDPKRHPYGGWARLATWLEPDRSPRSFPDLKAISFRIQAGNSKGWFDSSAIHGVTFRLHSSAIPDSVAYSVRIPYDSIRPAQGDTGRTVCIDLDELRQAGWYTGDAGIRTIDPSKLTALSWTISLDEPTAISAAPSRITLWDAKLWTSGTSALDRSSMARPILARAIEGLLVVAAERGRNIHVQVRDVSGRVVLDRSLWASGREQRLPLPRQSGLLLVSVTDGASRTHLRVLSR
jgi:hypothetical protein